jgi:hypothetical protein
MSPSTTSWRLSDRRAPKARGRRNAGVGLVFVVVVVVVSILEG